MARVRNVGSNQLLRSSQRNGRRSARADGQAGAGTERIVGRDGVIARGFERVVGNIEVQDAVVDLFELNLSHGLILFYGSPVELLHNVQLDREISCDGSHTTCVFSVRPNGDALFSPETDVGKPRR